MSDTTDIDARLHNERNVWLTTVRPDGRPHVTPIWYVYLRTRFWIGTGRDNVKTANVTGDPRVVVALEDGNQPVVAEGIATVHGRERPADVAAAFADKYRWDIGIENDPDVGTVVLWEIVPTKWLFARPSDASE